MVSSRPRVRFARLKVAGLLGLLAVAIGVVLASRYLRPVDTLSDSVTSTSTSYSEDTGSSESTSSQTLTESVTSNSPLDPILADARSMQAKFAREVDCYSATLTKRERVNGKLGDEQTMFIKVRNRKKSTDGSSIPMGVYVRFEEPSSTKGREVIWVEDRDKNQLVAHEGGWLNLARVSLAPDGTLAMMGNKYPITQIGLGKLLDKLIEKGERYRSEPDCQVLTTDGVLFDGIACRQVEIVLPAKKSNVEFHIARILIDPVRQLPLRYEAYLWPTTSDIEPPLEEQYSYRDIRLNPPFTDLDFDPNNPEYKFP